MADADMPHFLVRFWGVRGSYPTPGPHTLRHGGNTACVEVQAGGRTIILDAGSGLIRLGESLLHAKVRADALDLSLFITHAHNDHLLGFPFFAPLFDPRTCLHLFGPQLAGQSIEGIVTTLMSPPYFPVDVRALPSQRSFHELVDEQCVIWHRGQSTPVLCTADELSGCIDSAEVCVHAKFMHNHPLDGSVIYRIEYAGHSMVYATDVEWSKGCDSDFVRFIHGADLLIHDAQYTEHDYQQVKHGYGHSTIEMATAAASAAGVGTLILFHHEPAYDDAQLDTMEREGQMLFKRTYSAYEGMEINLFDLKD